MSAPQPTKTSGRIILAATITAKPGQGEKMVEMLAAIRKLAESDKEKFTHTYRTTRLEGSSDQFLVFEEYELPNGVKDHMAAAPFQALSGAGIVAALDIKYYEEFSGEGKFVA